MRKIVAIIAAALLAAASSALVYGASNPGTGVNGSPHDMNIKYPGNPDSMGRVCVFCHTPHNANMGGEPAGTYPLWNHEMTDNPGSWQSYVWATPTNMGLDTQSDPIMGPSRLCMSCHDGVIAPDSHMGSNGANAPQVGVAPAVSGFKAIGLLGGVAGTQYNLTDDHPISFSYDDAVLARNNGTSLELAPKTDLMATAVGVTDVPGTYNEPVRNGKRAIQDVLFQGSYVTCASCHEVHNKDNVVLTGAPAGANYLLWAQEKDSLICLSCHKK